VRYRQARKDPIAVLVNLTVLGIGVLFALGGFIGICWAVAFLLISTYEGLVLWLLG